MEIVIIHGEHHTKSYERLQKYIEVAKERNWEVVKLDSETSDISLTEKVSSGSLFATERLFIIDYKSISKKDIKWLNKNLEHISGRIVVYSSDLLTEPNLKSFEKVKKIEVFKLPRNIFSFLTSFYPGNTQDCLSTLAEVKEQDPVEFIFALLGKHLRDLYWVSSGASNIPYPSWRVMRLESQARKFSKAKLKIIINKMASLDILVKTSQASLEESLDLLIVENLE
jgi:DNA polymerase III delta subunit